jgi:hypothetical protein
MTKHRIFPVTHVNICHIYCQCWSQFQDTNVVGWRCQRMTCNDVQCNVKKKRRTKWSAMIHKTLHRNLKNEQTLTPLKTGVNAGSCSCPDPLVAPVVLLLWQIRCLVINGENDRIVNATLVSWNCDQHWQYIWHMLTCVTGNSSLDMLVVEIWKLNRLESLFLVPQILSKRLYEC